jgi:hypothetical protein
VPRDSGCCADPQTGGHLMPTVIVGQENNADIEIHYEDHGTGRQWC